MIHTQTAISNLKIKDKVSIVEHDTPTFEVVSINKKLLIVKRLQTGVEDAYLINNPNEFVFRYKHDFVNF